LQLKRFTSHELQHELMRKAASPLRIIVMGVSGSGKSTPGDGFAGGFKGYLSGYQLAKENPCPKSPYQPHPGDYGIGR
jgi:hypothetical protein